jgi:UDP-N-acetylglucosamine 4,6-dehydratase
MTITANKFDNLNILITGGTGSFGRRFAKNILTAFKPRRVIIFSRDEVKQQKMRTELPDNFRWSNALFYR